MLYDTQYNTKQFNFKTLKIKVKKNVCENIMNNKSLNSASQFIKKKSPRKKIVIKKLTINQIIQFIKNKDRNPITKRKIKTHSKIHKQLSLLSNNTINHAIIIQKYCRCFLFSKKYNKLCSICKYNIN